jgi:transcriptional regulator with PAS, ATPase and Fis domain
MLIDKNQKIIRCNQSFANFVKEPIDNIIGHKCTEYLPCDEALLKRSASSPNIEVKTDKGRWLYLSFCPIKDENDSFIHSIVISTDITDLKNTQQRLMESEDELKGRIRDLENFYEMAVGRELKMKNLKSEVSKLTELLAKDKEKNKK